MTQPQPASEPLRILILSTPKTGNTWLLNLLAAMYDIPKVGLACPFDYEQASKLGERWAAFHHFVPEDALMKWIRETKPFLLTTVRHPGDVLLSLYHHIHDFREAPVDVRELTDMLDKPFDRFSIDPPATHCFHDELKCSLAWKRTGLSHLVRYEDLRLRTFATLESLAQLIRPVSRARIEQAIEKCDMNLMRRLAEKHGKFFRSGLVGEWRQVATPELLAAFSREPYSGQLAELGYTLDVSEPPSSPPAEPVFNRNPFRSVREFHNSSPVAPLIEDFYLSLDPAINASWPPIAEVGRGSFFEWMNSACDLEGEGDYAGVFLSRLVYYVYITRPDLQRGFPLITGPDRARYAQWFIRIGHSEYKLDSSLVAGVRKELVRWGSARAREDRERRPWWPKLTNFTTHIYRLKPALQEAFPDYLSADRWNLLAWMTKSDHGLEILPELKESIRADLARCAKLRAPIDAFRRSIGSVPKP